MNLPKFRGEVIFKYDGVVESTIQYGTLSYMDLRIVKIRGEDKVKFVTKKGINNIAIHDKMKAKFTALPNEIHTEPNTDRTNNIIIGIAVGVMISACGVIYLLGSLMG